MSEKNFDIRRLERYGSDTCEYLLAIITDEDHASLVELDDGGTGWQSTLRHDRIYRHCMARPIISGASDLMKARNLPSTSRSRRALMSAVRSTVAQ